jgi:putative ABC transport system substrate-binding protein
VQEGFVTSLAHPEGHITGLSFLVAELLGKRLELLKETLPQSTRVAVVWNPDGPGYASRQALLQNRTAAVRALALQLHVVAVRRVDALETAFAALPQAHADALLVMEDALVLSTRLGRRLADLAATSRLPAMYSWREYVDAGGVMAYGPSLQETYRRAATYVDKLLKGAKPADLPVEQPTQFELLINLKTAKTLGLTIPPIILVQADEVIQEAGMKISSICGSRLAAGGSLGVRARNRSEPSSGADRQQRPLRSRSWRRLTASVRLYLSRVQHT